MNSSASNTWIHGHQRLTHMLVHYFSLLSFDNTTQSLPLGLIAFILFHQFLLISVSIFVYTMYVVNLPFLVFVLPFFLFSIITLARQHIPKYPPSFLSLFDHITHNRQEIRTYWLYALPAHFPKFHWYQHFPLTSLCFLDHILLPVLNVKMSLQDLLFNPYVHSQYCTSWLSLYSSTTSLQIVLHHKKHPPFFVSFLFHYFCYFKFLLLFFFTFRICPLFSSKQCWVYSTPFSLSPETATLMSKTFLLPATLLVISLVFQLIH